MGDGARPKPAFVSPVPSDDDTRGEHHHHPGAELALLSVEQFCQSLRLQVAIVRRSLGAQRVSDAKAEAFASSVLAGIEAGESTFHPAPLQPGAASNAKRVDTYAFSKSEILALHDEGSGPDIPPRVLTSRSVASGSNATLSASTLAPVPMRSMGAIWQSEGTCSPVHAGSTRIRNNSSSLQWETHSKEDRRKKRSARRAGARSFSASDTDRSSALSDVQGIAAFRRQCQNVTRSWLFEIVIMFCVFSYSVWMGVELAVAVDPLAVQIAGKTFMAVFVVELLLRIVADGRAFFASREFAWNMFDLALVVLSVVEVALQLYTANLDERDRGGSSAQTFMSLRILRIIRITRLVRVLRIVRIVRLVTALRALVYSIMFTLRSLIWALLLLLMIIYAFAVIFTTGIRDSLSDGAESSPLGPDDIAAIQEFWSSLVASMYTLWLAVTGGISWVEVARPLAKVHAVWSVLFTSYIGFVVFAVLNVMTGVFCQSAIEGAARDRELSAQSKWDDRQTFIQSAQSLFSEIDQEGDGLVNYDDIEEKFNDPQVKLWLETLDIDYFDAWTFFKLIATRSTNHINVEEFVSGCLRLKGPARSIDIAHLMYDHRWLMDRFLLVMRDIDRLKTGNPGRIEIDGQECSDSNPGTRPGASSLLTSTQPTVDKQNIATASSLSGL